MKKIVYGFIALAAVFAGLTSCDDTNIDFPGGVDENVGPINIVVSTKGDDTRVYYQHNGTQKCLDAEWQTGDKVLAISPNGTAYELTVTGIVGNVAHIEGDAVRGVTVQLVYQKDISKTKWDQDGGLKVDFSEQHIEVVEPGKYQIAPAVFAGSAEIKNDGQGEGTLEYQCGIVKVSAVEGIPAGQTITKISLWGTNIAHGKYSYDKSSHQIVYKADERFGSNPNVCDEICVKVGENELGYDENFILDKEVFFAVPSITTPKNESDTVSLKQATVTTTNNFYFHNIKPVIDETTGQVTKLGVGIKARDYYNIEEFEEYYFTVKHMSPPSENGNPEKDARKIQLAPGNLYAKNIVWGEDGIATNPSDVQFYFEKNQWDYRYIYGAEYDNCVIDSQRTSTEEKTCGSFLWSEYSTENPNFTKALNAYGRNSITYVTTPYGPTPYGPTSTQSKFFTQHESFVVSGQPTDRTYKWYTLTGWEWDYLVKQRLLPCEIHSNINYTCSYSTIKVNDNLNVKGLIIFHDNYLGPKSNLDYIPDGCAFLPVVGLRNGMTVSTEEANYDGSYWAAQLGDTNSSYLFVFFTQGPNGNNQFGLGNNGRAIRLARDLPVPPTNPTTE